VVHLFPFNWGLSGPVADNNSHDVSWGTKGDNKVSVDLGAAVGSKGDTVELEMPSEQLDIDSGYDDALRNLRDRLEVPVEPMTEVQIKEDYYRAVRTYVVVVWMVANAILAMIVTEVYGLTGIGNNFYLKSKLLHLYALLASTYLFISYAAMTDYVPFRIDSVLLWSVAALAVFRALGSSAYLVLRAIHSFVEGRMKWDPKAFAETFQPPWKRKLRLAGVSQSNLGRA